jgi:pimeloyl-ACP methyl ester carboxylesterase
MAYEMSLYKVGHQELFVREKGKQGRQVVLLIHSWSRTWYALSPLLPMLSKRRHCLAVDLPGYGQSPPRREAASIAGYANLQASLIRDVTAFLGTPPKLFQVEF